MKHQPAWLVEPRRMASCAADAGRRRYGLIADIDPRDLVALGIAEVDSAIRTDGYAAQTIRSVRWRFLRLSLQPRHCGERQRAIAIRQLQPMPGEIKPATITVEIEKTGFSIVVHHKCAHVFILRPPSRQSS